MKENEKTNLYVLRLIWWRLELQKINRQKKFIQGEKEMKLK